MSAGSLARVRIDRVVPAQPSAERGAGLELERPAAGGEWSGPSFELSGRFAAPAGGPAWIEVLHGARVLRRLPVRVAATGERPDGARACFAGVVTTLGLPAELRLEVVAVLPDGTRAPVATLEVTRRPLRTAFEPALRPILVISLDRLAPPAVMGLFAAHPQVVTLPHFPYECGTARYWLQALARLAQPPMEPPDEDSVRHVVREPRPGVGLYLDRVAEMCARNVDGWYLELAHHQVKERVRHFAERIAPGPLLGVAREIYPEAREVFVVRDPRDWIAGALQEARGREGATPAAAHETPEALVRRLASRAKALDSEWRSRRDAAHLLRYEDLVADPAAALRGLLQHLELDSGRAAVDSLLAAWRAESRSHRPYHPGSREPLGRWRSALAPDLRAVVGRALAAPLRAFGYAAAVAEPRPRPLGEVAGAGLEER